MLLVDYTNLGSEIDSVYTYFSLLKSNSDQPQLTPQAPCLITLCYFFAILAFGQQIQNTATALLPGSNGVSSESIPGLDFYVTACRLFQSHSELINFMYIQSSILLGLISCNLSLYRSTYNFFGIAVLSAVVKGYHRQIQTPAFQDIESLKQFLVAEKRRNDSGGQSTMST